MESREFERWAGERKQSKDMSNREFERWLRGRRRGLYREFRAARKAARRAAASRVIIRSANAQIEHQRKLYRLAMRQFSLQIQLTPKTHELCVNCLVMAKTAARNLKILRQQFPEPKPRIPGPKPGC